MSKIRLATTETLIEYSYQICVLGVQADISLKTGTCSMADPNCPPAALDRYAT